MTFYRYIYMYTGMYICITRTHVCIYMYIHIYTGEGRGQAMRGSQGRADQETRGSQKGTLRRKRYGGGFICARNHQDVRQ